MFRQEPLMKGELRIKLKALMALTALALTVVLGVISANGAEPAGAVYTLSNQLDGNSVLVFHRAADGSLTSAGPFPTAGSGTGTGLGNQGGAVLEPSHRWLFAVNAGSNDISSFAVRPTGLTVSFTPDGGALIVTERATNHIDTYVVSKSGLTSGPHAQDSPGATPFGFAFGRRNQLFVSEAFGGAPDVSALSSFTVGKLGALQVISPSVGTGQTAACWVAVSDDGRFAFVTNTGSSTISGYNIAFDGALQLLEGVAGTGSGAVIDAALSLDGRYLYVLSGDTGNIDAFEVQADGALTPLAGINGLPIGSNGLAAR